MAVKSLIETVTVGAGGAASIEFASIAANWTDLKFLISARNTAGTGGAYQDITMNINATGVNTSIGAQILYGNGSSPVAVSTGALPAGFIVPNSYTSNTFSNNLVTIPNYTSSSYKSFATDSVQENNAASSFAAIFAGLWSNTSAITSVSFGVGAGTFAEFSTASLYGIKYD
jgi:hypothetical protein